MHGRYFFPNNQLSFDSLPSMSLLPKNPAEQKMSGLGKEALGSLILSGEQ